MDARREAPVAVGGGDKHLAPSANPPSLRSVLSVGALFRKNRKLQQAIDIFKKCVQIDPKDFRGYYNVASCTCELATVRRAAVGSCAVDGQEGIADLLESALPFAQQAAALAPNEVATWALLSGLCIKLKLSSEACEAALRGVRLGHSGILHLFPQLETGDALDGTEDTLVRSSSSIEGGAATPPKPPVRHPAATRGDGSSPEVSECMYNLNVALRQKGALQVAAQLSWSVFDFVDGDGDGHGFAPPAAARPLCLHQNAHADSASTSGSPPPVVFVCVKWGSKYGPEYVNNLQRSLRQFCTPAAGAAFQLVCFTDRPDGIDDEVVCKPLPSSCSGGSTGGFLEGWWTKAWLFSAEAAGHLSVVAGVGGGAAVAFYLDLDVLLTSNAFSELVQRCSESVVLARDGKRSAFVTLSARGLASEGREQGFNSSVIGWDCNDTRLRGLYNFLMVESNEGCGAGVKLLNYRRLRRSIYKFDHYLEMALLPGCSDAEVTGGVDVLYVQDLAPGYVQDFAMATAVMESLALKSEEKRPWTLQEALAAYSSSTVAAYNAYSRSEDVCLVIFPLTPKPHELLQDASQDRGLSAGGDIPHWVQQYWRG